MGKLKGILFLLLLLAYPAYKLAVIGFNLNESREVGEQNKVTAISNQVVDHLNAVMGSIESDQTILAQASNPNHPDVTNHRGAWLMLEFVGDPKGEKVAKARDSISALDFSEFTGGDDLVDAANQLLDTYANVLAAHEPLAKRVMAVTEYKPFNTAAFTPELAYEIAQDLAVLNGQAEAAITLFNNAQEKFLAQE